jgi:predicted Zn finger-like uncharacterized protein
MFTVCPKCALTLVVSAADLRVAQGYVRCGRCSSVFNALARLSDEQQAAVSEGEPAAAPAPEPETRAQEERADLSPLEEALGRPEEAETPELPRNADEPVSENALEFNPETTDVGAVFVQPPPNPQWTAGPPSEPPPAELPRPAPPRAPEPQELAPPVPAAPPSAEPPARPPRDSTSEPGKAAAGAAIRRAALPGGSARTAVRHAPPHARPQAGASTRLGSGAAREPEPGAREAQAPHTPEEALPAALDLNTVERATPHGIAARCRFSREEPQVWGAGVVLGLVLLTAQIVNHYRDELAATPRFNRPLTAFYASLGVQLVPRWDPRAYEVRQLGASADAAGSGILTVRASIKNSGRQPQPLPLLRVTLQDRFGNTIAARDVAPRFYVPPTVPESSYLASGQRIDAEMGFLDPGANALGFEIDACLPASGGGITCANDLATR